MKNIWMVDGQIKKMDGWMDINIYEKIWMVGWIKKIDGWWMDRKNEKIDGQLDGYKKKMKKMDGWMDKKQMDGWKKDMKKIDGWLDG